MGFILNVEAKETNKFIELTNFPVKIFIKDLINTWDAKRLIYLFEKDKYIKDVANSRGYTERWIYSLTKTTLKFEKFFLPDMYYILNEIKPKRREYQQAINALLENTFLRNLQLPVKSLLDLSKLNDLTVKLKPYQEEFLSIYEEKKQRYNLKGYILAFSPGLGKSLTALGLMHCLNKGHVFIIAPKTTVRDVWYKEIMTKFKDPQDVWVVGDKPKTCKWYIVNYESINKLQEIINLGYIKNTGLATGVILDEMHNFKDNNAKRSTECINLCNSIKCNDILAMSGTPIKAVSNELLTTLELLDPLYTESSRDKFKLALGVSVVVALDILKNRLGLMMHRKLKSEVLDLPSKEIEDIKISTANGHLYTVKNVKKQILSFKDERSKYYKANFHSYANDYDNALNTFKKNKDFSKYENDFKLYLEKVKFIQKNKNTYSMEITEAIVWVNNFEKIISSYLPSELKKKFTKAKSVVKYVDKTIMGEVIGGLLNRLRSNMFREMMETAPLEEWITTALKKTVCFTTYVEVAEECAKVLDKIKTLKPVLAYGRTSFELPKILDTFRTGDYNPLIATIQTLATGVTITEANQAIFLNKPWRSVDYWQSQDRIYRIGQDTTVYIKNLILDTGIEPNLSTRMEDILNWSKEMFEGIVGDIDEVSSVENYKGSNDHDTVVQMYKEISEENYIVNYNQFNNSKNIVSKDMFNEYFKILENKDE